MPNFYLRTLYFLFIYLCFVTNLSETIVVEEREYADEIICNKFLFFFVTLLLWPIYLKGCLYYGNQFLYLLAIQIAYVYILASLFYVLILPVALFIFDPYGNLGYIPSEIYEKILNAYFLIMVTILCKHGRTLTHRKGFYFDNWKEFTYMNFQMYLFGHLLGLCYMYTFFTFCWVWPV